MARPMIIGAAHEVTLIGAITPVYEKYVLSTVGSEALKQ